MNIILFDGECNLCNNTVRFVIKHDREALFRFAPLQSTIGKTLSKHINPSKTELNTLIYIEDGIYFTHSTAILRILKKMGGVWKCSYLFIIIPPPIRNLFYKIIVRLRHHIFNKTNNCPVFPQELQERFIDR